MWFIFVIKMNKYTFPELCDLVYDEMRRDEKKRGKIPCRQTENSLKISIGD